MTSRVIRPARVLEDAFPVELPDRAIRAARSGAACEAELRAEVERLLALREEERAAFEAERSSMEKRIDAEVTARLGGAVAALEGAAERVDSLRRDALTAASETVVRLAVAMAEKIIGHSVKIDAAVVVESARRALALAAEREELTVRLHPDDLAVVEENREMCADDVRLSGAVRFEGDRRIRRGGCLVVTETGDVDARVEKQIEVMERALMETLK